MKKRDWFAAFAVLGLLAYGVHFYSLESQRYTYQATIEKLTTCLNNLDCQRSVIIASVFEPNM